MNTVHGYGNVDWRRANRRTPADAPRMPRHVQPAPDVTVVVDTSGSMSDRDLGLALGAIQQGLRTVPGDRLEVISGDTRVAECQKVFSVRQVALAGGGGTDMGAIVEEICRRRKAPDVIVVVTDGYTPWPSRPVRPTVVAALTRVHEAWGVPEWIHKVEICPKGE